MLLRLPIAACAVLSIPLNASARNPGRDAPLPNAEQLKQRVIENEHRSAEQKERYLCDIKEESAELASDGSVKRTESKDYERFFIRGKEIDRLLAKNGKPLSASETKKEEERSTKEVTKFSDPGEAQKADEKRQQQIEMFLRALRYTNGSREQRSGRSTVIFDLIGDPKFHATSIEQRFAKALEGRIWIDEETGQVAELRVETKSDVKIAGGLLANLHKGFHLHLQQTRQPDGVWLTTLVEGNGDARAGLFFHPRFRFKQSTGKCRLYSVDATSTGTTATETPASPPSR
jgi:hypothetical protein